MGAIGGGDECVGSGKPEVGIQRFGEGRHESGTLERTEAGLPSEAESAYFLRCAIDARLDPAYQPVAKEDRQNVVAPAALRRRRVDLPAIVEAVERQERLTVPHDRIERGQEAAACVSVAGAGLGTGGLRGDLAFGLGKQWELVGHDVTLPLESLDRDRDELAAIYQLGPELVPQCGRSDAVPQLAAPRSAK